MAANDALARGAKSVTFPSNSHIKQDRWDAIFGPRPLNIAKKKFSDPFGPKELNTIKRSRKSKNEN